MLVVVTGTVILRDRMRSGSRVGEKVAALQGGNPAAPGQIQKPQMAQTTPKIQSAQQELKMYENLGVLEDYDMLASIEGIPEPAQGSAGANIAD